MPHLKDVVENYVPQDIVDVPSTFDANVVEVNEERDATFPVDREGERERTFDAGVGIVPSTLRGTLRTTSGEISVKDNGYGRLEGENIEEGTVNYETGQIYVRLSDGVFFAKGEDTFSIHFLGKRKVYDLRILNNPVEILAHKIRFLIRSFEGEIPFSEDFGLPKGLVPFNPETEGEMQRLTTILREKLTKFVPEFHLSNVNITTETAVENYGGTEIRKNVPKLVLEGTVRLKERETRVRIKVEL